MKLNFNMPDTLKEGLSSLMKEGGAISELSRREFITKGISVAGWGSIFLAAGAGTMECIRFFYPKVVFHPPSTFVIGKIQDFATDSKPDQYGVIFVDDRFKTSNRFFIIRDKNRIFALFARCTHLGCTVNWFPGLNIFKCPCHGSEFHSNGHEFAGPAPRPLDRLKITQDAEGNLIVDTAVVFSEREFEKQKIYIEVA